MKISLFLFLSIFSALALSHDLSPYQQRMLELIQQRYLLQSRLADTGTEITEISSKLSLFPGNTVYLESQRKLRVEQVAIRNELIKTDAEVKAINATLRVLNSE